MEMSFSDPKWSQANAKTQWRVCVGILLVCTVTIFFFSLHKTDHAIISRTKAGGRGGAGDQKPPLKLQIITKECFSDISAGRAGGGGVYIPGVWLVLVSESQAEEVRVSVIRGRRLSLAGSRVRTCMASQS